MEWITICLAFISIFISLYALSQSKELIRLQNDINIKSKIFDQTLLIDLPKVLTDFLSDPKDKDKYTNLEVLLMRLEVAFSIYTISNKERHESLMNYTTKIDELLNKISVVKTKKQEDHHAVEVYVTIGKLFDEIYQYKILNEKVQ